MTEINGRMSGDSGWGIDDIEIMVGYVKFAGRVSFSLLKFKQNNIQ